MTRPRRPHRRSSSLTLVVVLSHVLALAWAGDARAQSVPVIAVQGAGDDPSTAMPAVNRVAAAIGPEARVGAALNRDLVERYAAPPTPGDPLASLRDRISAASRAWTDAQRTFDAAGSESAINTIDSTAQELESRVAEFDSNPANLTALQSALVFLAERWERTGFATRAEDAMRRLARVDPSVAFSAYGASPPVQHMYAEAVAVLPRGALSVDSAPPGCTVIRDGRPVGTAPVELQDLAQGVHRIQVRCGAAASLMHPVNVVARTRATLVVDTQLDAALSVTGQAPVLRYPSVTFARARVANDLVLLGRALGARRVYAVFPGEDRVVVVDVATSAEVGDSPVTDGSHLRSLLGQAVVVTPVVPTPPSNNASERPHETRTVVVRHASPVSPAAIVIGVLGLGGIGVGVYGAVAAQSAQNRAEQASDAHVRWVATGDMHTWQIVEGACLGGGAALVLTGVLIGIFVRPRDEIATVRVSAVPLPEGGGLVGVAGRF